MKKNCDQDLGINVKFLYLRENSNKEIIEVYLIIEAYLITMFI